MIGWLNRCFSICIWCTFVVIFYDYLELFPVWISAPTPTFLKSPSLCSVLCSILFSHYLAWLCHCTTWEGCWTVTSFLIIVCRNSRCSSDWVKNVEVVLRCQFVSSSSSLKAISLHYFHLNGWYLKFTRPVSCLVEVRMVLNEYTLTFHEMPCFDVELPLLM